MKKIGEHLIENGSVSEKAVEVALSQQKVSGGRIGEILQSNGDISAYKFYQDLAKYNGLEFIDLTNIEIEKDLLLAADSRLYNEMGFLPISKINDKTLIASTDFNNKLKKFLEEKYGNIEIKITSPFDIFWATQKIFREKDDNHAREKLFDKSPEISAKTLVARKRDKILIASIMLGFVFAVNNYYFAFLFLIILNLFYSASIISKIIFFIFGLKKDVEQEAIKVKSYPIYSILVPLFKEKLTTIKNLSEDLLSMNYPKDRLDIKLIVEEDDLLTIEHIKSLKLPAIFQIVKVPYSKPQTKPKACNYALIYTKGEFVTIYDAEDKPDPDQLLKALYEFENNDDNLACVQAHLNYYNRKENLLTKMFAIEYSCWFDFMLKGLERLKIPIPLGGTSNHFRIKYLKEIYAWDPYNVTEDADLGVRLAVKGYKTKIINSFTYEEAPITVKNWLKQRVRWIKGYMQTYFVHIRNPVDLFKKLGFRSALGFFFFVGAPFFVFFTIPITLAVSLFVYNKFNMPEWFIFYSKINLAFGVVFHILLGAFVIIKNKWHDMILSSFIFPFYWILHCIASYGALWQLLQNPHYWNKTEHGQSKLIINS
jgi:cellulose synthase/poly-beta-1,6-N-acetylglucosamine synthase-like glycosyltransferase